MVLEMMVADHQNTGTGRNTANTMDLLSTSSAEFEDVSTTESEYEREYTNLESGLLPSQPARPKFVVLSSTVSYFDHLGYLIPPLSSDSYFFGGFYWM